MAGRDVVARARSLVGTPFRRQGRGADGFDCVGLAAAAWDIRVVPGDYSLRSGDLARVEQELWERKLVRRPAPWPAGAVLVMQPPGGLLHLGIWTGDGLVHADLQLRRVVERPGAPPWRVASAWVMQGEEA